MYLIWSPHCPDKLNPQTIMVERRYEGKRRARHAAMGVRELPKNARGMIGLKQLFGERSKGRAFAFLFPACLHQLGESSRRGQRRRPAQT
jgi:hypothetical protein